MATRTDPTPAERLYAARARQIRERLAVIHGQLSEHEARHALEIEADAAPTTDFALELRRVLEALAEVSVLLLPSTSR